MPASRLIEDSRDIIFVLCTSPSNRARDDVSMSMYIPNDIFRRSRRLSGCARGVLHRRDEVTRIIETRVARRIDIPLSLTCAESSKWRRENRYVLHVLDQWPKKCDLRLARIRISSASACTHVTLRRNERNLSKCEKLW